MTRILEPTLEAGIPLIERTSNLLSELTRVLGLNNLSRRHNWDVKMPYLVYPQIPTANFSSVVLPFA